MVYFILCFSFKKKIRTSETLTSNRKEDQNTSFTRTAASDELSLDDEECLDYGTCSVLDLDTAKQELEEFIPHVRNISDSSIRKMAGRDLMRFKQFKKQGELSKILLQRGRTVQLCECCDRGKIFCIMSVMSTESGSLHSNGHIFCFSAS